MHSRVRCALLLRASALPVRASATPLAKCHHASSTGRAASGCASARISSWRPKRSSTEVFIVIIDSTIGIIWTCGASFSATSVAARRAGFQPAAHHLGVGQEVQVVDEVREPVERIGGRRLEVLAVGPGAGLVRAGGGGVIADSRIHVRRHVGQVAGGRRERVEPHRTRQRADRCWRRFHGVDVVVIGAEVIRIACEHGLQHGDDLVRAVRRACRRATRASTRGGSSGSPRRAWRRRDRRDTGVRDRASRSSTGAPAPRDRAWRRSGSESPSLRCTRARPRIRLRQRQRPGDRAIRLLRPLVVDIEVVVRAERPGDAPVRHWRVRVELRRAREGARRFLVVEAEDEVEALVEVALRLSVRGRDRMMVIPEPGQERHGLVRG